MAESHNLLSIFKELGQNCVDLLCVFQELLLEKCMTCYAFLRSS